MNKITITLLGLLAVLTTFIASSLAQGTDEAEYVFRNQIRPEYEKTIDLGEFNEIANQQEITLIDVRLTEDFALDPILIPGAEYKDPENISKWALDLPKDKKIVLYCVKGAWVSHKAATYLSDQGYDVVTLDGGLRDWKAENNK